VEVDLSGKNISGHGLHYPYRAYFEDLMSYNQEAQEKNLYIQGWHRDTTGQMDSLNLVADGPNVGLAKRATRFNTGRPQELVGRLHADIFHCAELLPPNTPLKIKLTPNDGKHCLITAAPQLNVAQVEYRLHIQECYLRVRKLVLHPKITVEFLRMHATKDLHYPLRSPDQKFLTLNRGVSTFRESFLTIGQVPKRVFIAFLSQAAHDGSYQANPFNFQNFGIKQIYVQMNEKQYPQPQPIRCVFAEDRYMSAYLALLQSVGKVQTNKPLAITYEEFRNGFCIFGFDLTKELQATSRDSQPQTGSCTLFLEFTAALQVPLFAYIYEEHQKTLILDRFNNPIGPL
jgi:hypothetical protein